jgi:GNAT superfamily N-acetyltransferase
VRVEDLRPGWRTDFTMHGVAGVVEPHDDCLVVRTPSNPTFYWGNLLLLEHAPRDEDVGHWLARFEAQITQRQPESDHVAIGINEPYAGQRLPQWEAAGLEMHVNAVMRLAPGKLVDAATLPPPKAAELIVRPIDWANEVDAIITLECADVHGFEPAGYRAYRERLFGHYRVLHAQGRAEWFGVWCDGVLAADCGLVRDHASPGATARFQRVATHPDWRRRGLARALVHGAGRHALQVWQAAEVIMVADPDDIAIHLYRSLGWREFEREWCFERRSPRDQGLATA